MKRSLILGAAACVLAAGAEISMGDFPQPQPEPAPVDLPLPGDPLRAEPCAPPSPLFTFLEERRGAGPVVRFHTRGSRVEESEAYREELRRLPLGHSWPQYEVWIRELGFEIVDAVRGPRDRPRFALVKEGLLFGVEITCDEAGRVASIDPGPNL